MAHLGSPDVNSTEHRLDVVVQEIRIMEVQLANLQQLRDAVISIWTKIARSYLMQRLMASRSSLFWAFYK